MQCPRCGHPEMKERNQDETLSYGGQSVTIRNLRGEFCQDCSEGVWDSESNQRLDEAQMALINDVRAAISADIRRIRKSLKLTQAKLAENLGLGPLALSRYERGKTTPPVLLVKVLRLLEKDPNLLDELRQMEFGRVPTRANIAVRRNRAAG